jgi:predicted MPP superfamily phosphohydrolase
VDDDQPPKLRKRRLTRRALLASCVGSLGTLAGGVGYAHSIEPFGVRHRRLALDLPGLHPDLLNLRILHLSDLHVAPTVPRDFLRGQIQRCAALDPDLVFLTGDFVTRGDLTQLAEVGALMRALRARHGVFAVLGNHDYGVSSSRRHVPAGNGAAHSGERVAAELAESGVTVLRNGCRTVKVGAGQLQVAGVEDYWSGLYDPGQALANVDPTLPCIVLCHNPDAFVELRQYHCDWVLAGHTHGGQVRIPLLGAPFLPIAHREYDAGLFREGAHTLYVNRGLGYLFQVRFNCRPEFVEFTLTRRA